MSSFYTLPRAGRFACSITLLLTAPLALEAGEQVVEARPVGSCYAPTKQVEGGKTPPLSRDDLTAVTQAGARINLSQVRGWKVVYFWSSACPCVASCQKTSIAPLVRKYRNKVRFFAIASNAANLAYEKQGKQVTLSLGDVAEQKPPPGCPLLLDPHHRLADTLKATHTPQAFLLSPDNRVLFCGDPDNSVEVRARTGKEGVTRRYLADALGQALTGKKVVRPLAPLLGCEIDRSDASK